MREIFDALDRMDPAILIAVLVAFLALLTALEYFIKWLRVARAAEYLEGYTHGYHDGHSGSGPAYRTAHFPMRQDVPESFRRAYR